MSISDAVYDDGWAILAQPPGKRDLGSFDLWERSLIRSRRRREREAMRRANLPTARKVGFAIAATAVLAPLAQQTAAAQTHATTASLDGMLRKGDRGAAVAAVQRALGIPADGVFGPQTRRAVKAFQARRGLEVDGIVGPITRAALGTGGGSRVRGPAPSRAVTIALQSKLGLVPDGVYGPLSRAAVRGFQARHGLEVDGIVGPMTMAALGISGSSGSSPAGGGGSALGVARSMIGQRYVYGGEAPGGFDCSGLMVYAFRQAGITLPRTSWAQFGVGVPVSRANVQAGDLVFFNASGPGASHVGIATSNATAISATTHGVMEHTIGGPYWGAHYVGARRP
jgi:peptidoglycan hydrolase-like protein with peptidoglycan-binding domain